MNLPNQENPTLDGLTQRTLYVVIYCADGTCISYDLADPKVPLPSFRSVVARQERLGEDFERVLYENLWGLY